MVDLLASLTWMTHAANFKNGMRAPRPKPLPRPTDPPPPPPIDGGEAMARFEELRAEIARRTGAPPPRPLVAVPPETETATPHGR